MNFRIWINLLVASGSVLIPTSISAQEATDLRVGQVIGNEQGQVINGWTQVGGTHYQKRSTKDYVTTETTECCVTTFKRGDTYLFAATDPIARGQRGGVEAERITVIKKFTIPADENEVDCSLMWIMPATSFSKGFGSPIRSIIFDGTEFVEIRWSDPGLYCDFGD